MRIVQCLLCVILICKGQIIEHLPYKAQLDEKGNIILNWKVSSQSIKMRLTVKEKFSTFGMGFSNHGSLKYADVFMISKIKHQYFIKDYHTNKNERIISDSKQDYFLSSVLQLSDGVIFNIERELDTCDSEDFIITRDTMHILTFLLNGNIQILDYLIYGWKHVKLNVQRLQLIKSEVYVPKLHNTVLIQVLLNNITIPAEETTYWCYTTMLPQMPYKQHIVQFDAKITPTSEGIVHHMEVFHCEITPTERVIDYNGPCNSEMKPMGLGFCRKVIGAWAMGATGLSLPKEAGIPIGGESFSRYVVLEVHFNNPLKKSGLQDSSGIQFQVSPHLRQNDAGIMELGLDYEPNNAIPPGQTKFSLSGYCLPGCTLTALPVDGIVIFASQLHTHSAGIRVRTAHLRNGRRLSDLNADNNYSPHFQEIRLLPHPVRIKPGDALVTTCTYNTEDRTNVTVGGISISDEMCLNYVYYYPIVELEVCKSHLESQDLQIFFDFINSKSTTHRKRYESISEEFNQISWNSPEVKALKTLYKFGHLQQSCNTSSGWNFPGQWNNKEPISVPKLEEKRSSCLYN